MNETESGRWRLRDIDPDAVLERLPLMDRVMLAIRQEGLLLERLGRVGSVTCETGEIRISGSEHAARLPVGRFAGISLDTTMTMRGKVYPRLEFEDETEARLFSVTGLEGLSPVLDALDGVARQPDARTAATSDKDGACEDVDPADPTLELLERLRDDAREVEIRATRHGMLQSWRGTIDKVMPMGGHVNLITPGFHLHVAAGAVRSWAENGAGLDARDAQGVPLGLSVLEMS